MSLENGRAPTIYAKRRPDTRPVSDTPLHAWMELHGITNYGLAKLCNVTGLAIACIRRGQSIPSLVVAFKIERATQGAVPASSWLGTDLGRFLWEHGAAQKRRRQL